MEEQFNREAEERWRFAADAARIMMKERALKIESIRQEEFLWQSTAIWEQLLERKKEQLCPSQERRKNCVGMGKCAWRDANVCSILLAHGGMVPKR